MTDMELIYNQCKYTRDGTPTHIAKNNAYDWVVILLAKHIQKYPVMKT